MPSRSSAGQFISAVAVSGAIALVCTGCGTSTGGGDTPTPAAAMAEDALTPLIGSVAFPPVPFPGSDGKTHLVYELSVTNFSTGTTTVEGLTVLDADSGTVVEELDSEQVSQRLQAAGARDSTDRLESGRSGTMFLHLTLDANAAVPGSLIHEVSINSEAAPPGMGQLTYVATGDHARPITRPARR